MDAVFLHSFEAEPYRIWSKLLRLSLFCEKTGGNGFRFAFFGSNSR